MTNESSRFGPEVTAREYAGGQKVFGRYTLRKVLGRGGMGIVWLARDEELERDVALKFLPDLVVLDKALLNDLKRETRRSLELTHKNIVRIHDFVQGENSACISMEYIDGDTLSNLRTEKEQKVFQPEEIAAWTSQLCEALDYAHNHARIIHRDLKPANLMVNQKGELKVSDFGIARRLGDSMSQLTMAKGTSGTLVYMSPQQLNGERGTHLDDIYSLGATLYDLLTSKPPFYSGNVDKQVHERTAPSMTERRKEFNLEPTLVPPLWEAAVAACLAKDPAQRPQSSAEIAHRLQLSARQAQPASATGSANRQKNARAPARESQAQSMQGRQASEGERSGDGLPIRLFGMSAGRVFAGIFLACAGLGLVLHFTAARGIEQSWQDWLRRAGRKTPAHPEFVFLGMSSKTLTGLEAPPPTEPNRALQLMTERPFPWSRELWALLLDRLFASGARLVIFDMIFAPPNEGDAVFRAAIDKYRDKVVLGGNIDLSNGGQVVLPNEGLISPPQLEDNRVGFINFWPDGDETIRSAPYLMAGSWMPVPPPDKPVGSVAARALEKLKRPADIPQDRKSRLIRFSSSDAYPPRPLWEIFKPDGWHSKYAEGEFFEGKIIVVGSSSTVFEDFVPTPIGLLSGSVLQLHALAAAMDHEFLREPSPAVEAIIVIVAGVLTWAALFYIRRRLVCLLASFSATGAYFLMAYFLYNTWGVFLPLVAVIITIVATTLFALGVEQMGRVFLSVRRTMRRARS